jgi:hypothetical protein
MEWKWELLDPVATCMMRPLRKIPANREWSLRRMGCRQPCSKDLLMAYNVVLKEGIGIFSFFPKINHSKSGVKVLDRAINLV